VRNVSLEKRIETLERDVDTLKQQMKLRMEESRMFLNSIKLIYKRTRDEDLKRELGEQIDDLHINKKPQ
jgi:hypothetical protein